MADLNKQQIRMHAVSSLLRSPFAANLRTIGDAVVCAEALAGFIETGARWAPPEDVKLMVMTPETADPALQAETTAAPEQQAETTAVPDGAAPAETTAS